METITAQVKTALAKDTIGELIDKLSKDVTALKTDLKNLDKHTVELIRLELDVARLSQESDGKPKAIEDAEPQYVVNSITGKCHKILIKSGIPMTWKTRCTWNFGLGRYELKQEPVEGYKNLCDTCLHELRRERKSAAGGV